MQTSSTKPWFPAMLLMAGILLLEAPVSVYSADDSFTWTKRRAVRENMITRGTLTLGTGLLRLDMVCAGTDNPTITLYLAVRDGDILNGYAKSSLISTSGASMTFNLDLSGTTIKGAITCRFLNPALEGVPLKYAIDLKIDGEKASGTFDGARLRFYGPTLIGSAAKGTIQGTFGTWAAATGSMNLLKSGLDWPSYNGPATNFVAAQSGQAFVDSLRKARFMWRSEELVPTAPGTGISVGGGPKSAWQLRFCGGGATPVVSGDKIYLSYYEPSGTAYNTTVLSDLAAQYQDLERQFGTEWLTIEKMRWLIDADDVIECIDASSGAILWKKVFRGKGKNYQGHKTSPENNTPCVSGGKVYAIGSSARVYCLNVENGNLVWESNLARSTCGTRDYNSAPIVAGGVMVMTDYAGNLIGLDGTTGTSLWKISSSMGQAVAARWKSQEKEYAVVPGTGKVLCVDPLTGKVVWEIIESKLAGTGVSIDGDYLVIRADETSNDESSGSPAYTGYRMSRDGAQKLWSLPVPAYNGTMSQVPPVLNGYVYLVGNTEVACVDIKSGNVVSKGTGAGGGNSALAWIADGRLFIAPDGKHGRSSMVMWSTDPSRVRQIDSMWVPPHPNTTSYHMPIAFPVVDGRMYIRGDDALYCYDLRKNGSASGTRQSPDFPGIATLTGLRMVPKCGTPGTFDLLGRLQPGIATRPSVLQYGSVGLPRKSHAQ